MEIRQLKYFLEVRRTGSISLAAENLSLTQPALSQQILLLERELGTKLFERSRRGMRPTQAAEQLAARAEALLKGFDELKGAINPRLQPQRISFAVGETLATHFIPGLVVSLRALFPGARVRVIESNLTEMRAALRDDKVDFAFSPEPIDDGHYSNRYLLEDEIIPVVSRANALARRRPDWEKLRMQEWILFHPGSAIRKISDRIFADMDRQFVPKVSMELRSLAGMVQCLEAGLGVGFISDLSLNDRLTALRLPALTRRRRFYLSHKLRRENVLPVAEAILRFAAQSLPANTKKLDAD